MTTKIKSILLLMITIFIVIFSSEGIFSLAQNNDIFFKNGSRNEKLIALTFDDGPHPKETYEILNILNKYNVKATAVPMTIIPIVASTPAKSNAGTRVHVLPAHNSTIPPNNIPIPVTGTLP